MHGILDCFLPKFQNPNWPSICGHYFDEFFYQMRELQEYLGVFKIIVIPYLDSLKILKYLSYLWFSRVFFFFFLSNFSLSAQVYRVFIGERWGRDRAIRKRKNNWLRYQSILRIMNKKEGIGQSRTLGDIWYYFLALCFCFFGTEIMRTCLIRLF